MIHSNFGEPILTAIYHIPIQLCLLGIWSMMTRGLAVSRRSSVWIIFTWKKHPADYQRANQKKNTRLSVDLSIQLENSQQFPLNLYTSQSHSASAFPEKNHEIDSPKSWFSSWFSYVFPWVLPKPNPLQIELFPSDDRDREPIFHVFWWFFDHVARFRKSGGVHIFKKKWLCVCVFFYGEFFFWNHHGNDIIHSKGENIGEPQIKKIAMLGLKSWIFQP